MKILIFLLCATKILAQNISCNYAIVSSRYTCNMIVNNPNGFDGFPHISGEHLEGRSNNDVIDIKVTSGTSPIIPQIICQQFQALRRFVIGDSQIGVRTISENSFKDCPWLDVITVVSPVTTIHLNAFQNNLRLVNIQFNSIQMATLPSKLLRTNSISAFHCISCLWLSDLPLNFFGQNSRMSVISTMGTNFRILRPEWHQNLPNLWIAWYTDNFVTELPRNLFNSPDLLSINFTSTLIRQLDYFSINSDSIQEIGLNSSPIEGIDFNIIERGHLWFFHGRGMKCANFESNNFHINREANLAQLEPCFVGFDNRILSE